MAYDEKLAERIRALLGSHDDVTERRMFGGICFMVRGAMCCGVLRDDLIVKLDAERGPAALSRPHVRPFDFSGRPMTSIVYVAPAGTRSRAQLAKWVHVGVAVAETKGPRKRKRPQAAASPSAYQPTRRGHDRRSRHAGGLAPEPRGARGPRGRRGG